MPEFEITTLSISGYKGQPVPNRFFRKPGGVGAGRTLGIVFPGLRYTCDMPLLYYPTKLLLSRGADVLQLLTDYTTPAFQTSRQEQAAWLATDGRAALQAGKSQQAYEKLVLIGKSIGTLVLGHLVAGEVGRETSTIWLTPLFHQPQLVEAATQCKGPALFAGGTGDPTYNQEALARVQAAVEAEVLTIQEANHSLEIPNDPFRSLQILERILRGIDGFLSRQDKTDS